MATSQRERNTTGQQSAEPVDELKTAMGELLHTVARRTTSSVTGRLNATTERLTDFAQHGGKSLIPQQKSRKEKPTMMAKLRTGVSGATEKLKQTLSSDREGDDERDKQGKGKVTDVVEAIDVGVPVKVAYDQWTEFADRDVVDEAPNERIGWRSEDGKREVEGAVTFHEIAPRLTRVILVEEHRAHGLTGRAGDLARAHRRHARHELKDFQHHVMASSVLHAESEESSAEESSQAKRGRRKRRTTT